MPPSGNSRAAVTGTCIERPEVQSEGCQPVAHNAAMVSANLNAALPFYRSSRRYPDKSALWVEGQEYSYGWLAGRASEIAGWILDRTDGRPGRIGILATRSINAYVGILGSCWAGAGYVPLNESFPEGRLQQIIRLAGMDAIIAETSCLDSLGGEVLDTFKGALLLIDGRSTAIGSRTVEGLEGLAASRVVDFPVRVSPDRDAYLVFTSGTTGEPSGVVISVGNLAHAIEILTSQYQFGSEDRFSQFFDLSFDFSVMDLFVPWGVGAGAYVLPASQRMDPRRFIRERHLTVWTCIPSVITNMKRMGILQRGIFTALRFSCFSGEALTQDAARAWQDAAPNSRIVNLYGQTEAPIGSLAQDYGPDSKITDENGFVAIGKPLPGVRTAVLRETGGFAAKGSVGELAIAGGHVARGYLNNPELTAGKFRVLDRPGAGRTRWYRTGDLVREDEDGMFHFLGREDNEVKVSGHRVMLEEVEFYLRQCSGGRDGAVIPWPVRNGVAESMIAFVAGVGMDEERVKGKMKRHLPRPLVPRRILAVDELPLNRNGKVDRNALALMAERGGRKHQSRPDESR